MFKQPFTYGILGFWIFCVVGLAGVAHAQTVVNDYLTVRFETPSAFPLDSTTYYFGALGGTSAIPTIANRVAVRSPITGEVVRAFGRCWVAGTVGSGESNTFSIDHASGDVVITSTATLSAVQQNITGGSGTAVSLYVQQGDIMAIQWDTPTYATNPENVGCWVDLLFLSTSTIPEPSIEVNFGSSTVPFDNSNQNLFNGIMLLLLAFGLIVFYFKRHG